MTSIRAYRQQLAERVQEINGLKDDKAKLTSQLMEAKSIIEQLQAKDKDKSLKLKELDNSVKTYRTKYESLQEILSTMEVRCSHEKTEFFTKTLEWSCDNCHENQPKGAKMIGCRICNFDYCQKCGGEPNRRVYHFDRDSKVPWGVAVDFDDHIDKWKITRIETGSQFDTKGIVIGWRIHKVNRYNMTEKNRDKLLDILKHGRKCIIEFDITPSAGESYVKRKTRSMSMHSRNASRKTSSPNYTHLSIGKVQIAGTWYKAAIQSCQMATILDSFEAAKDDMVGKVVRNLKPTLVKYKKKDVEPMPALPTGITGLFHRTSSEEQATEQATMQTDTTEYVSSVPSGSSSQAGMKVIKPMGDMRDPSWDSANQADVPTHDGRKPGVDFSSKKDFISDSLSDSPSNNSLPTYSESGGGVMPLNSSDTLAKAEEILRKKSEDGRPPARSREYSRKRGFTRELA